MRDIRYRLPVLRGSQIHMSYITLSFFLLHCVRNKRMPAIGAFMKTAIEDAYQKKDRICNVKYIDPSYMIR